MELHLESLPLNLKYKGLKKVLFRFFQISVDSLAIGCAFFLNVSLHKISISTEKTIHLFITSYILHIIFLAFRKNYRFIWRYTTYRDLFYLLESCVFSFLIFSAYILLTKEIPFYKAANFLFTYELLVFNFLSGNRILRRALHEYLLHRKEALSKISQTTKNVLLIGAGQLGSVVVKEATLHVGTNIKIKGFLDDDLRKKNSFIGGIPILDSISALPTLIEPLKIDEVIITLSNRYRKKIREVLKNAQELKLKVRILPAYEDIISNKTQIKAIRDIEIEDLLQRAPIQLETERIAEFVKNKIILITGAGGSIGSELVRQLCNFSPSKLILLDQSEYCLFSISSELDKNHKKTLYQPVLMDICDRSKIEELFKNLQPAIVLHAAAYKHVTLMEHNPIAALQNNVLGTQILCEAAYQHGSETFVLVSTDKAVKPTSVMGASKYMAEQIIQAYNTKASTRFCAVRFGNVLGSSGSVVPIFKNQIEKGGPLTITHPDMVRYFMTIPEACSLILQAASYQVKENLFILDMGEPVKIIDLATDLITLSGLKPHEDIEIVFTGIKKGEKLTEILHHIEEGVNKSIHPRIHCGVIKESVTAQNSAIEELQKLYEATFPQPPTV